MTFATERDRALILIGMRFLTLGTEKEVHITFAQRDVLAVVVIPAEMRQAPRPGVAWGPDQQPSAARNRSASSSLVRRRAASWVVYCDPTPPRGCDNGEPTRSWVPGPTTQPLSLPDVTATTLELNQAMNDNAMPDMPDCARRRAPSKEAA